MDNNSTFCVELYGHSCYGMQIALEWYHFQACLGGAVGSVTVRAAWLR